ncbi:hypothetical protein [Hymenobacter rubripertinctus]|uniref:hypothetical protein n=1 Tax=Hymenobacter rubripertinctus TaxID=2029981 RepID=UPI0011C35E75|nr:hypothetical protein [Hymenobacter rubripertinctus]
MRSSLLPALALLGPLLLAGCRQDKDPQPDPCAAAQANPLSFRFLENYGTPTPDTAYAKQDITFEGPGAPYTSYEWRVGNDARVFTDRQFSLYFYEKDAGDYRVRLIARRPPNTKCFPNDDGVDTLTKVLSLVPRSFRKGPIYGKFQGSTTDAPRDTFTIRIFQGLDPYNVGSPIQYDFLRNLSRGCQSPYFTLGLTWRAIQFNYGRNDFSCLTESGIGYLTTRDSIRVDYSQFENDRSLKRINRVFRGKRVR